MLGETARLLGYISQGGLVLSRAYYPSFSDTPATVIITLDSTQKVLVHQKVQHQTIPWPRLWCNICAVNLDLKLSHFLKLWPSQQIVASVLEQHVRRKKKQ